MTNFHTKEIGRKEQFVMYRSYKNINSEKLMTLINESNKLIEIFNDSNPNNVAETIVTEFNRILNELAPARRKNITKNDLPYLNENIAAMKQEYDNRLTEAIRENVPEGWRVVRTVRNLYNKAIDKGKTEYYKRMLNTDYNLWRTLESKQITTPTEIMYKGKMTTSPKKIAEAMNKHFNEKIKHIRENFEESNVDAIEILSKIVKKPKTTFNIPEITYNECYKIISSMRLSGSAGLDGINSRIIRMVPKITALLMTHLINTIIRKDTYPDILKISRILPILKPDKSKIDPDSYRPICNLSVFNKIIQEWLKTHLMRYMLENKIILENHHGGLANHSTMRAKAVIAYQIQKGLESNT